MVIENCKLPNSFAVEHFKQFFYSSFSSFSLFIWSVVIEVPVCDAIAWIEQKCIWLRQTTAHTSAMGWLCSVVEASLGIPIFMFNSKTSMTRTPMAHLPWLVRSRFWVPRKFFDNSSDIKGKFSYFIINMYETITDLALRLILSASRKHAYIILTSLNPSFI